jgi:hypothetical protein
MRHRDFRLAQKPKTQMYRSDLYTPGLLLAHCVNKIGLSDAG